MDHSEQVFTIGQTAIELGSDRSTSVAGAIKFLGVQTAKHPVCLARP